VYLNAKNGILGTRTIHVGTATTSLVGVRDVYREAIREGATQIAVVHNHPSGDPTPSIEDIDVTDKLVEAGKLMDVHLIDHIIIGHHTFVSLKEKGYV
jgi:DNA repair protein RadC